MFKKLFEQDIIRILVLDFYNEFNPKISFIFAYIDAYYVKFFKIFIRSGNYISMSLN